MRAFINLAAAAIAAGMLATSPPAFAQGAPQGGTAAYQTPAIGESDFQRFDADLNAQGEQVAQLTSMQSADVIGDGEADFGWGNLLITALTVLGGLIVGGAVTLAALAYARATGRQLEAKDADALRTFMQSAYSFAVNAVAPAVRDKKLTVHDASPVVEWMLHYAETLFPQLVEQFGGREANRMRAWSIVPLAEGESIPLATPAGQPIAAATIDPKPLTPPASSAPPG